MGWSVRGDLAPFLATVDGALVLLRGRLLGGDAECLDHGWRKKVSADFLPEAFGPVEKPAGDHYTHIWPGVYVFYGVNESADVGCLLGGGSINKQDIGCGLVNEGEDIVVCESSAEEFDVPAVALEEVGHYLAAELLELVLGAADDDFLVFSGPSGEFVLELVDDGAVYSCGEVLLCGGYAVCSP